MTKTPAQLDREIAESLSRPIGAAVEGKQPLYGHTSEATAYVVADYPYGFTKRTQIRYWLEGPKPKKGWRFVSQTLNPQTGRWNKPKTSTYTEWGGAMFLDDKGHVHWDGVGVYSDAQKILAFVTMFPGADMRELRKVVPAKLKFLRALLSGEVFMTVNKVRQPRSEADDERTRRDLEVWEEIKTLVDRAE
jgi:hypothetical protein